MGRKYLTEAELEEVRANPYVAKASAANISYTADFKRLVRRELLEGKNIMDIFRDAGFDVAALGWPRIAHFKQKIMEFADPDFKEKGKLITKEAPLKENADEDDIESLKKRVRWLEHQLAYTQQEVEFVKKFRRQIRRRGNDGNRNNAGSKIQSDLRSNQTRQQSAQYN